jgi:hypothetical protein
VRTAQTGGLNRKSGGERGKEFNTDILALLARRSRKVLERFLCGLPRAALADSLCLGLLSFIPAGFQFGLRLICELSARLPGHICGRVGCLMDFFEAAAGGFAAVEPKGKGRDQ